MRQLIGKRTDGKVLLNVTDGPKPPYSGLGLGLPNFKTQIRNVVGQIREPHLRFPSGGLTGSGDEC